MSNYKDRGIMKWAPFDALTGHGDMLEDMIYNINKKQKQELSDDEYQELNETIKEALESNKQISIEYYDNGYSFTTFGRIKKLDTINKQIKLDTEETIPFEDVLQIRIMR